MSANTPIALAAAPTDPQLLPIEIQPEAIAFANSHLIAEFLKGRGDLLGQEVVHLAEEIHGDPLPEDSTQQAMSLVECVQEIAKAEVQLPLEAQLRLNTVFQSITGRQLLNAPDDWQEPNE